MRTFILAAFALALAACGAPQQQAADGACNRGATHEVTWSSESSPDVVSAHADGPTCVQAVATFVVRNSAGDALWTFASTYYDLAVGGIPPEGAPPVTNEEMDRFLASWTDVTLNRTSDLPAWRDGAPTLEASSDGVAYHTEFDRETYETLRARNLAQLCFAAAAAATQCLIIDPISQAPTIIVAFGA